MLGAQERLVHPYSGMAPEPFPTDGNGLLNWRVFSHHTLEVITFWD